MHAVKGTIGLMNTWTAYGGRLGGTHNISICVKIIVYTGTIVILHCLQVAYNLWKQISLRNKKNKNACELIKYVPQYEIKEWPSQETWYTQRRSCPYRHLLTSEKSSHKLAVTCHFIPLSKMQERKENSEVSRLEGEKKSLICYYNQRTFKLRHTAIISKDHLTTSSCNL